jgi:hypothetical protein
MKGLVIPQEKEIREVAVIYLTCPGCQSKLNAKEELVGQTRKCPKCGADILITAPADSPDSSRSREEPADLEGTASDQKISGALEEGLPTFRGPERLVRLNQYIICDNAKVVATWQNNGHGWMLRTPIGLVSAARNADKIPTSGDFKLAELQMAMLDDVPRLEGLLVYRLANRWALTALNKGEDAVLTTISGLGSLNRDQKAAIHLHLREHVTRAVWEHAGAVLEYLGNVDYHSPGAPRAATDDLPALGGS